ncbi:MAG: helix-turn-helix transcriptional regulator [Clostridiales bacterium]
MKNILIPTNLKILRILSGNTQKDISEILDLSMVQYSKKEKGKAPFSLAEAKKLSEYFNITIEEIFFASNNFIMRT